MIFSVSAGLKQFCSCNCELERLDVSWCQDITGEGVKAIVQGCDTLTHLGKKQNL